MAQSYDNPTDTGKERPHGRAEALYAAWSSDREPYLQRARFGSQLTIPSLFPEAGSNGATSLPVPWQSLGGYGVNVLTAKIMMVAFPAGVPFIFLKPSKDAIEGLEEMPEAERGELRVQIDLGLAKVVRDYMDCIGEDGDRSPLFDGLRHMVVGGTHGFKMDQKTDKLSSFSLDTFVNRRSSTGFLLDAIIETSMEWDELAGDVQDLLKRAGYVVKADAVVQPPVNVYTWIKWRGGQYQVRQEVWGETIPGSEFTYNLDACPYLFPRMVAQKGEHYGRSWLEDYFGDLQNIDGAWQMLMEGGAAAARLVWLAKAGGTLNKENFAKAPNGAVITGSEGEIVAARADKGGDIQVLATGLEKLEERYKLATLQNSAVQRSGERVTGIEIKYVAQELEATLGGVWSNLVVTLQQPYGLLKMKGLQRHNRVAKLPEKAVAMTILTGDRAIGRQEESMILDDYVTQAVNVFKEQAYSYLGIGTYLRRKAALNLIDTDGLVKSDEAVQAEMQQQMVQQVGASVAPNVVDQVGRMGQTQMQGGIDAALQEQEQANQAPPAPAAAPAPAQ